MGSTKKDPNDMTFIEHLEELRWRIIRIVASILIGSIVCFFFRDFLRDLLLHPLLQAYPDFKLQPESPQSPLLLAMKLSFIGGIVLGFPYIVFQLVSFIFPGLYPSERKWILIAFPFILGLFFLGIYFCYAIIIPVALQFFVSFGQDFLGDQFVLGSLLNAYTDFLLILVLMMGLCFQFPVLVIGLNRMGILERGRLASMRPYVLIGIMVLALLITPELLSMILFTVPMYLLFEGSLLVIWIMERRERKESV